MFITLEGIEGSGKTTQMEHITRFLQSNAMNVTMTREPGGTDLGRKIRGILLDPRNRDMTPEAELLLYTADRAQHIKQVILPALDAGRVVLCDRYFDATLVYQGYARGLDITGIEKLHQLMCDGLLPSLTLLFDLSPEEGLARAWKQIDSGDRAGNETRFEKEAVDFHRKVRQGYLELARRAPERFEKIDAGRSEEEVREQIFSVLTRRLLKHRTRNMEHIEGVQ
jgi:dTMP kinase